MNTPFEKFQEKFCSVPAGDIFVRTAGSGEPIVFLHGNPQTGYMWNKVAPAFTSTHAVVCPDLRGYGRSYKPPVSENGMQMSKREMAADVVHMMKSLGHEKFLICAHDRGARVAHRLALDFPEAVKGLVLLDIVPTIEHFEQADLEFAKGYYHWFWLAQPHPVPEQMISGNERTWFGLHTQVHHKDGVGQGGNIFSDAALSDYLECIANPLTFRSICEDYRAAISVDCDLDRASRASGDKIQCPTMVLWGSKSKVGKWYRPQEVWAGYCTGPVAAAAVDAGHYLAEENSKEVIKYVAEFFNKIN